MANKRKARLNEELAQEIVSKFSHSLTWRNPLKEKWDRWYRLYRSSLEDTAYPWQSNIFVPYAFSTVESVAPRMLNAKPQLDVMPRGVEDVEYAKVMNKLIDYEWEVMGMDLVMNDIVKEMLIYGTAIAKVYWLKEEQEMVKKVQVDEAFPELGVVEDTVDETVYDAPVIELVDLYDFFFDPLGVDIDSCRWVAQRMYRTYDHLEEQQKKGIYKNVKLLKEMKRPWGDDDKSERRGTLGVSIPPDIEKAESGKQMVELIEYWEDDRVVTLANREVIIREEENPYQHGRKPFVRFVDQAVPHEFYGIGELEPIETLQYELNSRRNQRLDNVTLALNRMWIIEKGSNVDEDELVSDAGGVIHTDDINGIKEIHMPDVTASSYKEETEVKSDIQQTTGVSDFTRGMGSDSLGNDTATGISLIQEAGNARFKLKIRNLEASLSDIGEMLVSLNEQFISDARVIRVFGDEGVEWLQIRPEDMQGNLDVKVEAGSTLPGSEAVRRKQVLDAYQLFAGDPDVNQKELKRMVIQVTLPEANAEKLMPQDGAGNGIQSPMLDQSAVPAPAPQGQLSEQAMLQSTFGNQNEV